MAALQVGIVVPDEDKSAGRERTYSMVFISLKRKTIIYSKAMQDPPTGGIKRLTHAISARPAGPTLSAVFSTNEEVIPGAPCPVVTAPTVLKYTAT